MKRDSLGSHPGSPHLSAVTLGRLFNLSMPQRPCLGNGHGNGLPIPWKFNVCKGLRTCLAHSKHSASVSGLCHHRHEKNPGFYTRCWAGVHPDVSRCYLWVGTRLLLFSSFCSPIFSDFSTKTMYCFYNLKEDI